MFVPSPGTASRMPYAAVCCARGPYCSSLLARHSGVCLPRLWMSQQPRRCIQAACRHCRSLRANSMPVCRTTPLRRNCLLRSPPRTIMHKKPKHPTSPRSLCSFRGGRFGVYIPAARLPVRKPWYRLRDGSIIWKPRGGGGIDRKGSGEACARFIPGVRGRFYVTLISSAPHGTEHNDVWIRVSSGVDLFRTPRTWRGGSSGWYKAYQNMGGNRWANYVVTVDFNGHQIITKPLLRGRRYEVCLSGRSSRFRINAILLIGCGHHSKCDRYGRLIRSSLRRLRPSRCA